MCVTGHYHNYRVCAWGKHAALVQSSQITGMELHATGVTFLNGKHHGRDPFKQQQQGQGTVLGQIRKVYG